LSCTGAISLHSGYKGGFKGQRLDGDGLWELFEGLKANSLLAYSHVLTGFIGTPTFLQTVGKIVLELKTVNPALTYLCDPVLGDNGELYVPREFVQLYKDVLVPLCDIMTPNQTEAEFLTGKKIVSVSDAAAACDCLHEMGVAKVLITSMVCNDTPDSHLVVFGSHRTVGGGSTSCFKMTFPLLPTFLSGTGDLTAALLMCWDYKENDFQLATEKALASVQAVVARTHAAESAELLLVSSRTDLDNPVVKIKAVVAN
jgi:pyridoxine kinase